jgi:hypothetical protein
VGGDDVVPLQEALLALILQHVAWQEDEQLLLGRHAQPDGVEELQPGQVVLLAVHHDQRVVDGQLPEVRVVDVAVPAHPLPLPGRAAADRWQLALVADEQEHLGGTRQQLACNPLAQSTERHAKHLAVGVGLP